jgi:hypothetical protein
MTTPDQTLLIRLLSLFSRSPETPERPEDWPAHASFAKPMKEPLSAFEKRTFATLWSSNTWF